MERWGGGGWLRLGHPLCQLAGPSPIQSQGFSRPSLLLTLFVTYSATKNRTTMKNHPQPSRRRFSPI